MKTITDVTLDLAEPNYSAWVGAMQHDVSTRTVRANLLDRGKPWKIPKDVDTSVAYRKIDGTKGWYDLLADGSPAITVQGSTAIIVLAGQMLTAPGKVRAAIAFHDKALNQLTTFPFTVLVEENPLSDGEESSDFIRLQWLEGKLDEYLEIAKNSGEFDGKDGEAAVLLEDLVSYQMGLSGTTPPDGQWQDTIPYVSKGCYLWTRRTKHWSNHDPITDYSVSYLGLDGKGAVSSVAGISPDNTGDIPLTAANLGALPASGGAMEGPIHMNAHLLDGLNDPEQDDEAARKAYVDKSVRAAAPANLLDNSDFTNPVAQAGIGGKHGNQAYAVDRWKLASGTCNKASTVSGLYLNGTITQTLEKVPSEPVSAFVGTSSGSASISYSNGVVTITSSGGVIAWAALYEGTYTQDTMPEHRPKGYGAELAECLRYCQVISQNTAYRAFVVSANTVQTTFPLSIPMRVKPSIEQFNFEIRTLASVASEGFTFTANVGSENYIRVQAAKTSHGLSDANTVVTSDVILSADL